ncbi:DUF190 domain-containing protein [Sciscionella marina]|uniref:DUF190 domain-containing protein n=1 Tax=Sciscionella marina TaxID=508770 RepID=UPI0003784585|nr:DUF190 domain-containing protein [Sciscionella marina]
MDTGEPGTRASIHLHDDDRCHGRPLFSEIVHRAAEEGLTGATVLHGCEGYGASGALHTERLVSSWERTPAEVVLIDRPDRIAAFLDQLGPLIAGCPVVLSEVRILHGSRPAE